MFIEDGNIITVQIVESGLNVKDLITIFSVLIALTAVGLSFKSNYLTEKTTNLLLREYKRSLPSLSLYTITPKEMYDSEFRYLSIRTRISNKSQTPNTIVFCDLDLNYYVDGDPFSLSAELISIIENRNQSEDILTLPIYLDPVKTVEVTLRFRVAKENLIDKKIKDCTVVVTDTYSHVYKDRFNQIKGVDRFE